MRFTALLGCIEKSMRLIMPMLLRCGNPTYKLPILTIGGLASPGLKWLACPTLVLCSLVRDLLRSLCRVVQVVIGLMSR